MKSNTIQFQLINVITREIIETSERERDILKLIERRNRLNYFYDNEYAIKTKIIERE